MIHYNHNTGKHRNIKLNKTKRHALPHYRHTKRVALVKDTVARVAIVTALMAVLGVAFIIGTM